GYMAPEYAMRGRLTYKADVYSFGVVALEIVSGKSNTSYIPKDEFISCLLDWAYVLKEEGNLLDLVDPNLKSNYSEEEVLRMLSVALLCTNPSPSLRPLMSTVVSMLEGRTPVQESHVIRSGSRVDDTRSRTSERITYDNQTQMSTFSQESALLDSKSSMEDPWQFDSTVSYCSEDDEDRGRRIAN
ncbi:hypothetical protein MKW94_005889, partial [Papaver nudicaule]|nr:hypothetical protein [Papaver nudicaule]